jgi:site-specific recombinase XerC
MNPFTELTLPHQSRPNARITSRQLAALLDSPSGTTAAGVRDRALLQLLAEGVDLVQLHFLDLNQVDQTAHSIVVTMRTRNRALILLPEPAWARLEHWLAIRKLFAVNTEAVFTSLHWTAGRARPGTRLSERGMRAIIAKYLGQTGIKQPGINSRMITRAAPAPYTHIPHPTGETD